MTGSKTISPGMTLNISGKLYRVETCVKVTVAKGTPFIKTKLRDLITNQIVEKNFKPDQAVNDVTLVERRLEFLYPEGKDYLFLDIGNLEQILVPTSIITDKVTYLREGVEVKAAFYGEIVFSIELPQFLELMVSKVEAEKPAKKGQPPETRTAFLETGAKIKVPPFIDVGDIIKVDTRTEEYIQRV